MRAQRARPAGGSPTSNANGAVSTDADAAVDSRARVVDAVGLWRWSGDRRPQGRAVLRRAVAPTALARHDAADPPPTNAAFGPLSLPQPRRVPDDPASTLCRIVTATPARNAVPDLADLQKFDRSRPRSARSKRRSTPRSSPSSPPWTRLPSGQLSTVPLLSGPSFTPELGPPPPRRNGTQRTVPDYPTPPLSHSNVRGG